jgi:hypothetical protein
MPLEVEAEGTAVRECGHLPLEVPSERGFPASKFAQ